MIEERFRKLFIGGVDSSVTEYDLEGYFKPFGSVVSCIILRDRITGRSRGFGFVTFSDPVEVDAVQAARPHVIKGHEVELKRAVPKKYFQDYDGHLTVKKLFVAGIRQDTEALDLRIYFGSFGTIRKVDVIVERDTNRKRGFAFVEFDDYDPVDKIVLQGYHVVNGQTLVVKKAMSRHEMNLLRQRASLSMESNQSAYHHSNMQFRSRQFERSRLRSGLLVQSLPTGLEASYLNVRRRGRFF